MKVVDFILRLSDPRKVIACYTIFLVVRAIETDETQHDDVLLLSELCADQACDLSLGPPVDVFTDFDFSEEDKQSLWIKENLFEDINISYLEPLHELPKPVVEGEWWGKVFTPMATPASKCDEQVQQYLRDLRHYELWAMQMWDATAKPASGLLSGNSNQLGDYDSCLAVQLEALGAVAGKYCLAHVDLEATNDAMPGVRSAVTRLQAGAFVRSKHSDPGHFAPRWTTLHWGLCVPAACDDREVEAGLRHYLQGYQLPGVSVDSVIKPGMCYTSQQSSVLPLHTLVSLGFFGGFLMLAVVSTMVDSSNNYPDLNKLRTQDRALLAFSLRRNWLSLMSRRTDDLPVIHGVRSVFTVLLFAAHKLMPLALTPYSNRSLLTQYSHSVLSAVLRASSVFTDSFLQLSAVLAAYNLALELQRRGTILWRQRILARLVRLTPALVAVVVFYAYVMEHLGSGPQWTSSITVNADLCKANLWKNVLYIQNFFLFEDMCAPHTHQLALDMQLFLLAPLVVYCLHRWTLPSIATVGVLQLGVACLRYFVHLHYNISDFIYHNISVTDLYRNANLSYSQSIHRAIPYTVGLLTGFFLQRVGKLHLTSNQAAAGWVMSALLAAVSVFYPSHLVRADAVYDSRDGAWYAALSPFTWSVSLSWLIVACSRGYGGWLHWMLCQHWMVVVSRLSYAIYLTQFIIFFYYVGSVRSSQEFSLFYVIGVYEVVAVLLISVFVTLLFDLPMQEIKNILLPSRRGRAGSSDKVL
ncbi:nose resistant to fluoxetine protein 6-like [Macrosteles quadrilineatus]|uniref:nose resistant to fluoxetine protein 6-like n=1 Tax=Macrosteles quadrilineatus TaxID=74068 RepID=UPI0023E0C120|nr:nose resistant to fluoxetine protein 6-like [Macrosteles quadrilineatus]